MLAAVALLFDPADTVDVDATSTFKVPAVGKAARNTTGLTTLLSMRGGVTADPGENGHLYLEVAPDEDGRPGKWTRTTYVACRHTTSGEGQIGCGGTLSAILPAGGWYRVTTHTVTGYQAPDYIYDGGLGTFVTLD